MSFKLKDKDVKLTVSQSKYKSFGNYQVYAEYNKVFHQNELFFFDTKEEAEAWVAKQLAPAVANAPTDIFNMMKRSER